MPITLPSPLQYPLPGVATSTYLTWPSGHRSGIFYVGEPVVTTLNQNGPGLTYDGSTPTADAYTIRDWRGTIVGSGSIPHVQTPPVGGVGNAVGATITLLPTGGGNWPPGWYRVYLTGPVFNSYYGTSYGLSSFEVFVNHPAFNHNPDSHGPSEDNGAESRDVILKNVLGMGGSRLIVASASAADKNNPYFPSTQAAALAGQYTADSLWSCGNGADAMLAYQPADPVRPVIPFCLFPNGTIDVANNGIGYCYCKDGTIDGSKVFVSGGPGTSVGVKITVAFPNSSTIVEVWDNYLTPTTAAAAINAGSAYIRFFPHGGNGTSPLVSIGGANRTGVINTVQYLSPHGVSHYEGPSNEPLGSGGPGITTAHEHKLFQEILHSVDPSMVAMGPAAVSINNLSTWQTYFDACAAEGFSPDDISTHMYGSIVAADFNLGRYNVGRWFDLLKRNGLGNKKVWVTESTQAGGVAGLAVSPHGPKQILVSLLLLEQFGVPRNRNLIWYDQQHGFWNVPNFIEYADRALASHSAFCRVWAEETIGQLHHHALDFGSVQGNHMFLGSIFKSPVDGTATAMIVTAGNIPGATITFGVLGTVPSSFVTRDGSGVTSTVAVIAGKITVPLDPAATYIRIPSGTYLYVSSCLDWPANAPPSISPAARGRFHGTDYKPALVDNGFLTDYAGGAGFATTTQSVPDMADIVWNSMVLADHVIIFAGLASQPYSTLTDFDVQITTDDITWTTIATRTIDITSKTFVAPTDTRNSASTVEVYWDPEWVFNIPFGSMLSIKGVRLNVRETSWGGTNLQQFASMGFGNPTQQICLQEIMVPSASTPTPYSVGYIPLKLGKPGLLALWRFSEPVGVATATSEVNNSVASGTYTTPAPQTSTPSPGPISDGKTARVSVGGTTFHASNPALAFGDKFTIGFWHNSFNGVSANPIFQAVYPNGQQVAVYFGGGLTYVLYSSTVNPITVTTSSASPDSNWHYIVFTKDGPDVHAYVDGKDVTGTVNNVTLPTGLGNINMFAPGGGSNGYANLEIWNIALSPTEVVDAYNASTIPASVPILDPAYFAPGPVISGAGFVGEHLQCSLGIYQGAPTSHTHQWQRSANGTTGWTNIGGATRSDFVVDSAELGWFISCLQTPSNIFGAGATVRTPALFISGNGGFGAITNISPPTITGNPVIGGTLICSTGLWSGSPTTFKYQWRVSPTGAPGTFTDVPGATLSTYLMPPSDLGKFHNCGVLAS